MKKNFKISLFIAIMVFSFVSIFSITKVNAAYAYAWTIDGEGISRGSSNKSGTASWIEDTNYTGGVLTLNNYNGGQLKIDCYGTGLGHVFAIKLVGDNKINVDKGVGIIANAPIVFIGDGKLTINAAVPIGSGDIVNSDYTGTAIDKANYSGTTTVTIEPSTTNNNDNSNTINEDDKNSSSSEIEETTTNKDDDTKVDSKKNNSFLDSDLFKIIVLSYCAISLIVIIILITKLASKRKNI